MSEETLPCEKMSEEKISCASLGHRDSHYSHLATSLVQLQYNDVYSDVIICCKDKRRVRANKFLLTLASDYLGKMLGVNHNGFVPEIQTIFLPEFEASVVQSLVDLIQAGNYNSDFYDNSFYLWNTGFVTGLGSPLPPPPKKKPPKTFGSFSPSLFVCIASNVNVCPAMVPKGL